MKKGYYQLCIHLATRLVKENQIRTAEEQVAGVVLVSHAHGLQGAEKWNGTRRDALATTLISSEIKQLAREEELRRYYFQSIPHTASANYIIIPQLWRTRKGNPDISITILIATGIAGYD